MRRVLRHHRAALGEVCAGTGDDAGLVAPVEEGDGLGVGLSAFIFQPLPERSVPWEARVMTEITIKIGECEECLKAGRDTSDWIK